MEDENIWRVKKIFGLSVQQIDKVLKDKKENTNESDPIVKKKLLLNILKKKINELNRKKDIFDELSNLGIPTKKLSTRNIAELRKVAYDHYHDIIYGAPLESLKGRLENIGFNVPDDVDLTTAQQLLLKYYEEEVKYKESEQVMIVDPVSDNRNSNIRENTRGRWSSRSGDSQLSRERTPNRSIHYYKQFSGNRNNRRQHFNQQHSYPSYRHTSYHEPNRMNFNRTNTPNDYQRREGNNSQQYNQDNQCKYKRIDWPYDHRNEPQLGQRNDLQYDQRSDRLHNSQNVLRPEQHEGHQHYQQKNQTHNPVSFETRIPARRSSYTDPQMSQEKIQIRDQLQDQNQFAGRITGRRKTVTVSNKTE